MYKLSFLFICLLLFSMVLESGCKSNQKANSANLDDDLKIAVQEFLGERVNFIYNEGKDFVLCNSIGKSDELPVKFLIYDIEKKEIIYQNSIVNGQVIWLNQDYVQITEHLGNRGVDGEEGYKRYYFGINERKELLQIPEAK